MVSSSDDDVMAKEEKRKSCRCVVFFIFTFCEDEKKWNNRHMFQAACAK
jgi:hypothetical protein